MTRPAFQAAVAEELARAFAVVDMGYLPISMCPFTSTSTEQLDSA